MKFYLLVISTLVVFGRRAQCDVLVYIQSTDQIIEEFRSLAASFGPPLPPSGMKALAVGVTPENGCKKISPPPVNITIYGEKPKWVAMIVRYNCSFEDKIRNAQKAGYDAVIVYNRKSDELEIMSANDDSDIFIPSLFVGQSTGSLILTNYQYFEGFALVLNDDLPFNINTHLIIPFCIVVGLCFVVMIGFMIARCIRERRRLLRYRLPSSSLKKLESRKFNKNELSYDTCAICLDDYEEGDRLRILPCRHAYHAKCIDPWLTKNRRVCPVCKRKVYIVGERQRRQRRRRSSTSDSITSYEADDHTPLINSSQNNSSNHGTFPNNTIRSPPAETTDDEPIPNPGMSDDEILDGGASQGRRFNPFDRVPNLPPHLANDLYPPIGDENSSVWQRFKRFFRFNGTSAPVNIQSETDDVDVIVQAPDQVEATNDIPTRPASNNLMNSNLSGSFREQNGFSAAGDDEQMLLGNEADDDDDVEILGGSNSSDNSRRKKKNKKRHRSAPSFVQQRSPVGDDGPTTSSSLHNPSIGVPALPNLNFNPSEPPPSTSRARNNYNV